MKKRIMLFAIIMALMLGMLTVSAAADDAGAYEEMPDNFVILLDCSRSLETNDPQNLCLQACKNFVDKLPSQNAKVSVVAFGYRDGEAYTFSADYGISAHDKNSELIHTIIPLGDLNSTEATSEYKAIVESTNANNRGNSKTWTPISYAIAASVDMLEKASVQDGKACIILVSDGVNEPYGIGNAEGGYSMVWDDRLVESASLKAGNHQWTIYSIALNYGNKDAVETRKAASYLDKICANSGARNVGVIACEKPIDVHVAFQRIFRDFYRLAQKNPTVIKLPGSYSFQIPELTSEACVDIFSEDTTTNIESVKLVNVTDGTETWINKNVDDSNLVAVIEEGSYYSVKMFCPKAGEWKVEVYGDNDARVLVSSTEIKEMGLKMQTTPSDLSTAMNKGDSISVDSFFYYRTIELRNHEFYLTHKAKLLVTQGNKTVKEYEMDASTSGYHCDLSLRDLSGGSYKLQVLLEDVMFRDGKKYSNAEEFKIENKPLTVASTQKMSFDAYVNATVGPIDLNNIFNNPDGDPISCTVRCVNERSAEFQTTLDNGYLSINTGLKPGAYTLEIDAKDPDMKNPVSYKSIELNITNRPPEQREKLGKQTLLVNTYPFHKTDMKQLALSLDDYFTDPDGVALTYTVSVDSNCVELLQNGASIQLTPKEVGTCTVSLTASDGIEELSTSFEVKVEDGKAFYWKQYGVFYAIALAAIVTAVVVVIIILKNKRVKGNWTITFTEYENGAMNGNCVISEIDIGANTMSGHKSRFKLADLVTNDLAGYLSEDDASQMTLGLGGYFGSVNAQKLTVEGVFGRKGAIFCNPVKNDDSISMVHNDIPFAGGKRKISGPGERMEVRISVPGMDMETMNTLTILFTVS